MARDSRLFTATLSSLVLCSLVHAAEPTPMANVVQPFVDRHALAGAVMLVASKDKVLDLETVGYADISAKKRMTPDAVFWIASMSKPVTATALMMLVDEGKVRLDNPVEKYLPQFEPKIMAVTQAGTAVILQKPRHPISARNLLSHTSGIPFSSHVEAPTLDSLPLIARVQSYALQPLAFEPGADFSYSNAGINTAARIVEAVSGMPYEKFLQQRLFGPLGMKDTSFWPSEAQVERLAKSYTLNSGDLKEISITQLHYPLTDRAHRFPVPAGGLFSTASDLGKFCQMLLNDGVLNGKRYLSEAAIREMTRNQLDPTIQPGAQRWRDLVHQYGYEGYGLGWFTGPSGVFAHGGAYSTSMRIDPAHGLATVWLIQHLEGAGFGNKGQAAFEKAAVEKYSR